VVGLHCRTESVTGTGIPWVELGWIHRQVGTGRKSALVSELYSITVAEEDSTFITGWQELGELGCHVCV